MIWTLLTSAALAGPNTAMVGFSQTSDPVVQRAVALGGEIRSCYQRARFCVIDFPSAPPLAALRDVAGVRYAEADRQIPHPWASALPDPLPDAAGTDDCTDLWELEAVGAATAWTLADGSDGPVVAIADAGFLSSHEELTGHISGQYDYGNNDSVAEVEWDAGVPGHGTFIGAIIAGTGDNGVGRSGLAPRARLNLLKISDTSGALYFSYAASALADVADGDLGIRVVNYSIASSSSSTSFTDAVNALAEVDVVLVAAAGNCSWDSCSDADNDVTPLYPASLSADHVISVAGSTRDGGFNTYSHYGASSVDLAAPGVDICSAEADSDDAYGTAGGTSYAAPLVAATVALLLEVHPDLNTTELGRVLRASAMPNPEWTGKTRSGGVLSTEAALVTGVPRLDPPADLDIDGSASLTLWARNVGAAGDATLILGHDASLRVTVPPSGFSVSAFSAGDTLILPDAGTLTATGSGTLLRGVLAQHESRSLDLELAGTALGPSTLTTRLVLASEGADYLNAPYDDGTTDLTGFLAYSVQVDVTDVEPTGTGTDTGSDTGSDTGTDTGTDTGASAHGGGPGGQDDSGGALPGSDPKAAGCTAACSSTGDGPARWAWLLSALGLTILSRRRRQA